VTYTMEVLKQVSNILKAEEGHHSPLISFRTGARTRAVIATPPSYKHRLQHQHEQVLLKLYKGNGRTEGSKEYQRYHQRHFQCIGALSGSSFIQQSIEGGICNGVGPYAILEYVEGEELATVLDRMELSKETAENILRDILTNIWIPLWSAGLRFKDCHAGNFVLTPSGRTVMIDTEQMRKGASELLIDGNGFVQRDKHEKAGLKRLPGLIQRILLSANPQQPKAPLLRQTKLVLERNGIDRIFHELGRVEGSERLAKKSVEGVLKELRTRGWI